MFIKIKKSKLIFVSALIETMQNTKPKFDKKNIQKSDHCYPQPSANVHFSKEATAPILFLPDKEPKSLGTFPLKGQ